MSRFAAVRAPAPWAGAKLDVRCPKVQSRLRFQALLQAPERLCSADPRGGPTWTLARTEPDAEISAETRWPSATHASAPSSLVKGRNLSAAALQQGFALDAGSGKPELWLGPNAEID